jgi:hypothetical protein
LVAPADTPMYRTRPSRFISFMTSKCAGSALAFTMIRSIADTLYLASDASMCAFAAAAPGCGGPGGETRDDQNSLF